MKRRDNRRFHGCIVLRRAAVMHGHGAIAASGAAAMGHGEPVLALGGGAGRYDGRGAEDDFTQAGNLFRLLTEQQKLNLFNNLAGPLSQVDDSILQRQLGHFDKADSAYGAGVRAALEARERNSD